MQIKIVSTELIKPSISTPPSFQNYNISQVDELAPTMNVPIILYYPASYVHISDKDNNTTYESGCNKLKKSLSDTLTRFYPLAGRYIKESYLVDCSDQGAEFVEVRVDIQLNDLLGRGKNLKVDMLSDLLPRPIGAADEITDPLLAVQISVFACGGCTIGVCIPHRVADIYTISSFINAWTTDAKQLEVGQLDASYLLISPSCNSSSFFPGQKLSGMPLGISRTKENKNFEDHRIVTKVFVFNKSAISSIQEKARLDSSSHERLPSRVQSVFGIIGKAIIDLHVTNPQNPKGFLAVQAVNMRGKTDPPLPKNQFGNLYLLAAIQSVADERGVEYQNLVDLLSVSVKRAVDDCKMILSLGGKGQRIITNGFNDLTDALLTPGIFSAGLFTDWCKFPYYEADFGWGKPIWVSTASIPVKNNVYLLRDKSGEGIEAWVNLNEHDMLNFEKDCNIMEFTT